MKTSLEEIEAEFIFECRQAYLKWNPAGVGDSDIRAVVWCFSNYIHKIFEHRKEILAVFKKNSMNEKLSKEDRQWWADMAKELEKQLTLTDPHTYGTEGVAPDGVDNAAG